MFSEATANTNLEMERTLSKPKDVGGAESLWESLRYNGKRPVKYLASYFSEAIYK